MTVERFRRRAGPRGATRRTWHSRAIPILVALIAMLLAALGWQNKSSQHEPKNIDLVTPHSTSDKSATRSARITSVHDGDTFRIGEERVRIIGMDVPVIGDGAKCTNEQRVAEQSRDYLKTVLRSGNVRIERNGLDVYGRTLARVYIDGRDIAGMMLSKGFAKPYTPGHHGNWCQR